MDHASNRNLSTEPVPGEGAYLTFNAQLTRTTDTLQLNVQPFVSVQRYSNGSAENSNNASLALSAVWTHERSILNLTASYSDLSTLITELASTGAVQGNLYQRQASAGASWSLQQSDLAQLIVQLSYADVRYTVQHSSPLISYQYPSASIGEKFALSDRSSLTGSLVGNEVRSPTGPGTSRDAELDLTYEYSFSQRLTALVSAGVSHLSLETGGNNGGVGELLITRSGERSQWKLQAQRSVTPNGFGGLVLRDQVALTASRNLALHLSVVGSALSTRDRQLFYYPQQQARDYDTLSTTLNWQSGATSTIGLRAQFDHANVQALLPQPAANGWQVAVVYTWTPQPRSVTR